MSDETQYLCSRCGASHPWSGLTSKPSGELYCRVCVAQLDPKNERARKCPDDGATMRKKVLSDLFVLDKCPQCGGVWLDRNELEVLAKREREAAYEEGQVRGFFWGAILG